MCGRSAAIASQDVGAIPREGQSHLGNTPKYVQEYLWNDTQGFPNYLRRRPACLGLCEQLEVSEEQRNKPDRSARNNQKECQQIVRSSQWIVSEDHKRPSKNPAYSGQQAARLPVRVENLRCWPGCHGGCLHSPLPNEFGLWIRVGAATSVVKGERHNHESVTFNTNASKRSDSSRSNAAVRPPLRMAWNGQMVEPPLPLS